MTISYRRVAVVDNKFKFSFEIDAFFFNFQRIYHDFTFLICIAPWVGRALARPTLRCTGALRAPSPLCVIPVRRASRALCPLKVLLCVILVGRALRAL